ncbi:DNA uptake protein [Photobacterium marinum]|uniref:DNA uptake protein n=2 Tax=Photobacterium marinum TaxID=1056511 RepID=L8J8F9_9GAMM|nr:ComEA family DNA-binding protein [Photobacterium marinum]ELR63732.1 DNA uptake protein [Photobacterium marinum]
MKFVVRVLFMVAMLGAVPVSFAETDQYEGIEITVNINTANVEELDKLLVGVGPEKAARIVDYRDINGKFAAADDLVNVKGIGPATVDKNRERIKL